MPQLTAVMPTASTTPLERALDQNEIAKETVAQSADELLVINTVLKQEIPGEAQTGEIAQALQKNDELENRIQDTAVELAQVNQLLEQEIDQRTELEKQLAETQAALAKAHNSAG